MRKNIKGNFNLTKQTGIIRIKYRTACESLKQEKYLFLTNTPPYHMDGDENQQLFVQRVETLVSKEIINWSGAGNK